jgi:hypothetical protein
MVFYRKVRHFLSLPQRGLLQGCPPLPGRGVYQRRAGSRDGDPPARSAASDLRQAPVTYRAEPSTIIIVVVVEVVIIQLVLVIALIVLVVIVVVLAAVVLIFPVILVVIVVVAVPAVAVIVVFGRLVVVAFVAAPDASARRGAEQRHRRRAEKARLEETRAARELSAGVEDEVLRLALAESSVQGVVRIRVIHRFPPPLEIHSTSSMLTKKR